MPQTDDLSLFVQVGLAQVLGLVAIVVTLLVWRVGILKDSYDRLRLNIAWIRTGHVKIKAYRGFVFRLLQLSSEITGIVVSVFLTWNAFQYFGRIDDLTSPANAFDSGLFYRLLADADNLRANVVRQSFWASTLFVLGWVLGGSATLYDQQIARSNIPLWPHPRVWPRGWKNAPAAMWQRRIERAADAVADDELRSELSNAAQTAFREDWPTWSKVVILYGAITLQQKSLDNE